MQKQLFYLLFAVAFCFSACKKSDSGSEFVINNIHDVDLTSTPSGVLALAVTQTSGTQEPVTITVTGLPTGVTATIDPVSGTPSFAATITFKLAGLTTAGSYPIKVTGTSASYTKTYDLNLKVPARSRTLQITGTWKTSEEGSDDNSNGIWDASEHKTIAAADVSTILFNTNGSGITSVTYSGTLFTVPFNWNLQNSDNELRLISNYSGTLDTSILTIITLNDIDFIAKDGTVTPATFTALKKQ